MIKKDKLRDYRYVLLVLYVPLYFVCFFLIEKLVPSTADYWVSYCPLDDMIPFSEYFIIFYYIWYALLFAVGIYLMIVDAPEFKRYMYCIIIGFSFCVVFCLLFPNGQNLRPETFPRDNVFTDMVRAIYAADTNTNVIPSVHVIGAIFAAKEAEAQVAQTSGDRSGGADFYCYLFRKAALDSRRVCRNSSFCDYLSDSLHIYKK